MAESDISISEMTNGTFSAGALFPAIQPSQQSGTGYSNVKMSGADIGDGIGQLQFPLRLETENKSIFGAINEAAKSIINFLPIDTASGSLASFPDGANDIPLKSLACTINPVQSGSGDPSPSNIRPITGHTELNFVHTGANIWDEEWEVGNIDASGTDQPTDNSIRSKNYIHCIPNTNYYKYIGGSKNGQIFFYDKDKTFISRTGNAPSGVVTSPSNAYFMRFASYSDYGATYNNDISINYPSTDTSYHAYNGTSTTITFPDTVFGASLDVGTGVLTIDRAIYTFNGTETAIAYGSGYRYVVLTGKEAKSYGAVETPNLISNLFIAINRNQISSGTTGACVTGDTILLSTDTPTGVQVCYELNTPTTTQLTPQEVKSLLGSNNFYHDCNGQVAVTYRADIGLYIDKKTS